MKKRTTAILFALVLLLSVLTGCSANTPDTTDSEETESTLETESASVVETYREMAQSFLDTEDYTAAIAILEKGIDATGDTGLANLLKEALALQMSTEPEESESVQTLQPEVSNPFESVVGSWQDDERGRILLTIDQSGNAWLDVEIANNDENRYVNSYAGQLYTDDGGETFTAALFSGDASEPAYEINISRYQNWLEVGLYNIYFDEEVNVNFFSQG